MTDHKQASRRYPETIACPDCGEAVRYSPIRGMNPNHHCTAIRTFCDDGHNRSKVRAQTEEYEGAPRVMLDCKLCGRHVVIRGDRWKEFALRLNQGGVREVSLVMVEKFVGSRAND